MITNIKKNLTLVIKTFFILILSLFFLIFGLYNFLKIENKRLINKIYPRVYIDNVEIGGKLKQEATSLLQKKYQYLNSISLTINYHDQPIASFSAWQLNLKANSDDMIERAYLIGRGSYLPSAYYQQMATLFNFDEFYFSTDIVYDTEPIEESLERLENQYNRPAKNALFKFENGRVISFRQEENGLKLQTDQLTAEIDEKLRQLKNKPQNLQVVLTDKIIEPEIKLAQANQYGIEQLIGEGKSDYSHSIPGRIHNIILASSKFNGVLIPKNSIFSFNETVGEISSLTGYQPAYIIKGGRTVLGDGGGVCQVSTTLFRAALNAGLPITERYPHAYRVSYYENDSKPGFDATVFAPSVDLKIKNDTPAYILIQTQVDENNNLLYFRFYGKGDNRQIYISPVSVFDVVPPPPDRYQDDPTLKKGVVKQIDFAAWGGKANFDYKVTLNGKVTFEQNFFSSYQPWQAVFLQGTAD